jgi:hypothetical protein
MKARMSSCSTLAMFLMTRPRGRCSWEHASLLLVGRRRQRRTYNSDPNDKSTMSVRDNFTGFWNLWKHRIVERNYALLDEIHPNRIRSAEEWFRREEQSGQKLGKGRLWDRVQPENQTPILKIGEDMRTGKL